MITKNETKSEDNHQSFYHMKNGLLAKSKIQICTDAFTFAMQRLFLGERGRLFSSGCTNCVLLYSLT